MISIMTQFICIWRQVKLFKVTPGLWDDSYHEGVTHKSYNNTQTLQASHCKVPHVLHVSICGHLRPTSSVQSFHFGILRKNKLFLDQSYLSE